MTENKRFNKVEVYLSYEIFDNKVNEQLDVNKTVDLMNQLNDENEQLKYENGEIKNNNHSLAQKMIRSLDKRILLEKENKQLSEQLVDWETSFDICKAEKDELLVENKRLKLELETFKAGNQTLKATLDEVKND